MHKSAQLAAPVPRLRAWVWTWLLPLLLGMAALFVCLHRLGDQSLWLDEGYATNYVAERFVGQLVGDLFNPTVAYPLYHLVLKLTMRLLGDSEWALRLPSALAGALAVPALYALGTELRDRWLGFVAALLLVASPFAIWQAQDAKAYSLTLLTVLGLWWTFARALRFQTRRAWLVFAVVAIVAPFVHRLLVPALLGCAAAAIALLPGRTRRWRGIAGALVAVLSVGLIGGISFTLARQGASGQFIAVGSLQALGFSFTKFALDRWPTEIPRRWFVPFAVLFVLGAGQVGWALWRGAVTERRAAWLLALGAGVPLLIFLALFARRQLFEPRYLIIMYPAWLLVLAWGVTGLIALRRAMSVFLMPVAAVALVGALVADRTALYQPNKGLFSGARVKEEYDAALKYLAAHVHPDDMVVVQPEAIMPLYRYYAKRESTQPLPDPTTFAPGERAQGFQEFERLDIGRQLRTHKRAWLLIAPAHANVVDPPPRPDLGDDVGWVALTFQYGDREGRIQCGEQPYAGFNGVRVYCNNLPDIVGVTPQPQHVAQADFADALRLHGVTITPFVGGPKPGGTLPVSLFWEPLRSLANTDYHVFIHLTRPDDPMPLAQIDGVPMEGGQPTSRWTKPHVLLHDDRAIPLPAEVPPGKYVLRVGVYPADDPQERLPVGNTTLPNKDNGVIVAEVEIK